MRGLERIVLLGLLCLLPLVGKAQSNKVRRLEKQRGDMLRKIEATNKALQAVKKNNQEESKRLELVRRQVAQRKEVIAILGEEMQALEGQIDSLGGRISSLRNRESRLLEQYRRGLKALQRTHSERERLLFLFSAKDMEDLRQRQHFLVKYARTTSRVASELKTTRQDIERTQAEVTQVHQQKAEVLDIKDREKKALEHEEGKRTAEINNLKGQERKLSQDLDKQKRQAQQLEAQIQAQIAAEIAAAEAKARREREAREARQRRRAEAKRRAAERIRQNQEKRRKQEATGKPIDPREEQKQREEEKRDAEELARQEREDNAENARGSGERKSAISGGYAMDVNERKLSGNFSQNRGRLPMPVRGRYDLVRRFGTQQHDLHSRVSISNGGIDLRVYGDRSAYAVFEGVVSRVFVAAGYGQGVIVRHGNYLTVYVNLSSVRVAMGQRVSAGTVLGTISSDDSNGRGNTLHFELWHERSKQNPASWLRL